MPTLVEAKCAQCTSRFLQSKKKVKCVKSYVIVSPCLLFYVIRGGSRIFERGEGSRLGLQAKNGGGGQTGVQLWAQC